MTNRRLNILFLASWYPSAAHQTLGNFVQRHAEAVATRHNVSVLYTASVNSVHNFEIFQEEKSGVRCTIVYYKKGPFQYLRRFLAFLKGIQLLRQQEHFTFDLVHLNVIWPQGWQALYLKWKFDIPFIVTEHWTGYDKSERPYPGRRVERLSKMVARKAAMICPVTDNLGASMRNFGLAGKYRTVPNVVDTHLFHLTKKDHSVIHFIHVSSLDEAQKNISGILRSWKKAFSQNPLIHLHLGGDGPIQEVREEAMKMGIPLSCITFFGEQPWEGIAEMMSESHCLILFSNYENLPCVITEALASGLPVISTRVGGIGEHIASERGILIDKRDENALVSAILDMARNPEKYRSEALRQYAIDHFSQHAVADLFSQIYREILTSDISQLQPE